MVPSCGFQQEDYYYSYICSSICNLFFFSGCFSCFLFITAVVQFDYDVLGVVFFHVSFAGTVYLQVYGFHQIWKSYGYYLFLSLPSSHCPRTPVTCLLGRLMLSYIILMLHLGEVFFSCSILSSFHGCVLKFINLFS